MSYSKLLIPEEPLQVLPGLAVAIGLNEAIVLQQLHYWLNPKRNVGEEHDGRRWVYNTYENWKTNFPFWSLRTIQGIILKLEKEGLIESTDDFNKDYRDRTKWYTINYEHTVLCGEDANSAHSMRTQDWNVEDADVAHSTIKQRLPTETTPETITGGDHDPDAVDIFEVFWGKYPRKEGKKDARKAWDKLNPDHDLIVTIGHALHQQVENNWKGRDKKYIPLPASWLNGERWTDEITAPENGRPNPRYYDRDGNFTIEGSLAHARGEI